MWLALGLLTALATSSRDAVVKRAFSHLTPVEMGLYPLCASFPLFLAAAFLVPPPPPDPLFWGGLAGAIPLNAVAYFLYMRAIKISPLSLTVPFLSFTPVFLTLTGYVGLGEQVSPGGIAGIVLILAGSYALNVDFRKPHPLGPVRAAIREKGSNLMMVVAFIYACTTVFDKLAIVHSSPLTYGAYFYIFFSPILFLLCRAGKRIPEGFFRKEDRMKAVGAGVLLFIEAMSHVLALSLVKAAYMIALKRQSILFSVIYGKFIFKESNMVARLTGAVLMVAGTVLIALLG